MIPLRRFVLRAVLLSVFASAIWFVTAPWLRGSTIAGAKVLHRLVGYPAPHLLCELDEYYWFAPLFPPLVGLVLASDWVSLQRRALGLALGLIGFWYLVSLQLAVVYTPYLTLSATRAYLTSVYVELNTVVVPVAIWFIVTGGPKMPSRKTEPAGATRPNGLRFGWQIAAIILLCGLMTFPVVLAAGETNPSITAARRDLAHAESTDNPRMAIESIDMLLAEQGRNAALSFMKMRLLEEIGDKTAAAEIMTEALTTRRRRQAFHRQHE